MRRNDQNDVNLNVEYMIVLVYVCVWLSWSSRIWLGFFFFKSLTLWSSSMSPSRRLFAFVMFVMFVMSSTRRRCSKQTHTPCGRAMSHESGGEQVPCEQATHTKQRPRIGRNDFICERRAETRGGLFHTRCRAGSVTNFQTRTHTCLRPHLYIEEKSGAEWHKRGDKHFLYEYIGVRRRCFSGPTGMRTWT